MKLSPSSIQRASLAACLAIALVASGCASKVKLNDDQANKGAANAADARNVASVNTAAVNSENMSQAEAAQRLVYFDFDSYIVKPEFESVLQKNAAYLKADHNRKVTLEGHTDLRGSREYNLALGQKRADAVKQALNLLGVADSQMETISFGKEKPVSEDMSDEAQAKNRRVELVYK